MSKRNLYLKTIPVDEAVEKYTKAMRALIEVKREEIPVTESLGRVTARAVYARFCSPLFNAAAMDGVAVVSDNTLGATEKTPKILQPDRDYRVVDTGDPISEPYDAVIMAEDLMEDREGNISIIAPAAPWQHIRSVGEDIVAGEMILPGNHRIRPMDISVMLAAGILKVDVIRRPEVAIFPTGTEILEPEEVDSEKAAREGGIVESNSRMFENMVTEEGGIPHRFPHIPDDYQQIKTKISEAVDRYDMVIINAGSSAGTEDYTVHVLRELGEVLVHGVAIKPGKPVILAVVRGKPVIGLPGYPVSAYIGFENFVSPVLAMLTGRGEVRRDCCEAVITRRIVSSLKHKEYLRVKVGKVGDKIVASPLARGAGAAMSLVRADGFCVIEQESEGVEAGEKVLVELNKNLEEVEHTVVSIGSHDVIMDVISDMMIGRYGNMYLSSSHVGSMAGLMALKRGEAHIAPTHLLDEATGEYNVAAIRKLFREPMVLIKGVSRMQGIMVRKGNPLGIGGIADLTGVRFVNRQRGAGTRVLLDYLLKKEDIPVEEIKGYSREATTHMAVAAAVSGGSADAGMGVYSAAKAMNLDFIEVGPEEYDFAVPVKYLELPHVQAFIETLKSEEFHRKLDEMGGYRYPHAGEIVEISSR